MPDCHEKAPTGGAQMGKTGRGGQNKKRGGDRMNTARIAVAPCFWEF
jgi:hypothetical protein